MRDPIGAPVRYISYGSSLASGSLSPHNKVSGTPFSRVAPIGIIAVWPCCMLLLIYVLLVAFPFVHQFE